MPRPIEMIAAWRDERTDAMRRIERIARDRRLSYAERERKVGDEMDKLRDRRAAVVREIETARIETEGKLRRAAFGPATATPAERITLTALYTDLPKRSREDLARMLQASRQSGDKLTLLAIGSAAFGSGFGDLLGEWSTITGRSDEVAELSQFIAEEGPQRDAAEKMRQNIAISVPGPPTIPSDSELNPSDSGAGMGGVW